MVGLQFAVFRKDAIPQKTDVLLTNLSGRFAINIVDDLVVVHHQASKTSLLFDLNLTPTDKFNDIGYHTPLISKCSIKAYKINNVIDYELCNWHWNFSKKQISKTIPLDSPNWVIFQPNIIIDAIYGSLWYLQLNLDCIFDLIKTVPILIDFLILRKNSKPILLKASRNVVSMSRKYNQNPIANLSLLFNKLNLAYKESISVHENTQNDSFDYLKHKIVVSIDQKDMLTNFFEYFEQDKVCSTLVGFFNQL